MSRPIIVDGKHYPSAKAAAQSLGKSTSTISRWVGKGWAAYLDGQGVRTHVPRRRRRLLRWHAIEELERAAGNYTRAQAAALFHEAIRDEWLEPGSRR